MASPISSNSGARDEGTGQDHTPVEGSPAPPPDSAETAPARMIDQDEEALWGVLLDYIAEGSVVPVVGRDLLAVEMTGGEGQAAQGQTLLYSAIARELARALRVTIEPQALDSPNPLGAVTSEFILRGGEPNRIYRTLPQIVKSIDERRRSVVPDALRKLAEIDPFKLFVTTTFDPLLAECVAAVRHVTPRVLAYAPQSAQELADYRVCDHHDEMLACLQALREPVVVHILGRLSSRPNYVVTEEDAFEFVYSLQETRPEGLFDVLAQMKLLIVGCRFPHWLVRFFLRTARRRRLLQTAFDRTDFLVDPTATEDAALVQFLRDFKTQTEVFTTYGPMEFVDELSRRWKARDQAGDSGSADLVTPHAIFISYASEDADAASQIAAEIAQLGLPVWRDRGRLGSGDDWDRKIRRNIEAAGAFVPILSRASLKPGSREFRKEWRRAFAVKEGLPQNEPFIYPVVLDDVPRNSPEIDDQLRALNWDTRGADGMLSQDFVARLRKAYRSALIRGIPG